MPTHLVTSRRTIASVIAVLAAIAGLGGCPTGVPSLPPDTPPVPIPTSSGGFLADTSEELVIGQESALTFEPVLFDLPQSIRDDLGEDHYLRPGYERYLMVEDGVIVDPVRLYWRLGLPPGVTSDGECDGPPLAEKPDIQWVRYWKKIADVTIPEGTTYEQSHTYTEGTSETNGQSLAITLGLSASGWGLGLSAEFSATFSREVTIYSETSVTKTFTCESTPGKITRFTVWQLVEGFRFSNPDGSPFSDPEYDFVAESMGIDNDSDTLYMSVVKFD